MSARILIAVVLTLGAVVGVRLWNAHLVAQGDHQGADRVRTEWNTADAKRAADEAQARMRAAQQLAIKERETREQEQAQQQAAERIARDQALREKALRDAAASADARNRSLHSTIAQLNANAMAAAAHVPGTSQSACSSSEPDGATTARNALGQCSSRYAAVAVVADRLSSQVTGLQDFVQTLATQTQEQAPHGD